MKTNKKSISAGLLAGLFAGIGAQVSGQGIGGPSVGLTVDGKTYELPTPVPGQTEDGKDIWVMDNWNIQGEGFSLSISGELNPDPSLAYAIGITDFGAPSAFALVFFTPIVPTGSPNTVTGSVVGGLTDFTGDGVSITPTGASLQINDVLAPVTNMGVDVGVANAHPASGSPGSFYTYGAYAAGPIAGPGPGPWTGLRASLAFTLSGGGDSVALTGFTSIHSTAVPETSTTLAGGALAFGIAGWALRRRLQRA